MPPTTNTTWNGSAEVGSVVGPEGYRVTHGPQWLGDLFVSGPDWVGGLIWAAAILSVILAYLGYYRSDRTLDTRILSEMAENGGIALGAWAIASQLPGLVALPFVVDVVLAAGLSYVLMRATFTILERRHQWRERAEPVYQGRSDGT